MNGSPQVTHFLTAWALADESLNMFAHVFLEFILACQLSHSSIDFMVTDDLIVRSDDHVEFFFRKSEFFVKIEVFFTQW